MITGAFNCAVSSWRRFVNRICCGQRHTGINIVACLVLLFMLFLASATVYSNGNINNLLISNKEEIRAESAFRDDMTMSSYCSLEADRSGPRQNVISYSLYGNFSDPGHYFRYAEPIKFILSNISQVYPG